jgi:GH35 family endo-1,4-beta-xylanase
MGLKVIEINILELMKFKLKLKMLTLHKKKICKLTPIIYKKLNKLKMLNKMKSNVKIKKPSKFRFKTRLIAIQFNNSNNMIIHLHLFLKSFQMKLLKNSNN